MVYMGERRGVYRDLLGKHERKSHLKDLGANGRIILEYYIIIIIYYCYYIRIEGYGVDLSGLG